MKDKHNKESIKLFAAPLGRENLRFFYAFRLTFSARRIQ